MDDDDEFLYGDTELKDSSLSKVPVALVAEVPPAVEPDDIPFGKPTPADDDLFPPIRPSADATTPQADDAEEMGDDVDLDAVTGEGSDASEESEEDIEFIMEPANRTLDLRPSRPVPRNATTTPQKGTAPPPGPSLTTEYTPRERGGPVKPPAPQLPPTGTPISKSVTTPIITPTAASAGASVHSASEIQSYVEDGPDPATLPPVTAPPSHPAIDPTATGMLEGRPVFEVDMAALADKAWRRPDSDISDWFNYGFDEISWEAYCYRRRELGDLAAVLKTNVVNFSGMPEDQLTQLPPEIRTMVMTGAAAMMANGGGPMMQPGMNPMMAPEMGNMNMGPQMMDPMMAGMGGEMGMDGVNVGVGVGAPQQGQGGPMPDQLGAGVDGFGPQGGIGVGMGMAEYGIQDQSGMQQMQQQQQQQIQQQQQQLPPPQLQQQQQQQLQQQHMYQNMEAPVAPSPPVGPSRGITQGPFRGPRGMMARGGRGGYMLRGRGGHPTPPARPASPLPPNVPTGPRNQNKYKDRDNNAQAVDGLDYGGGAFGGIDRSSATPVPDFDDRTGRKRRDRSPSDDRREPKRR
ncbi:hypothetical protein F5148DRAFT_1158983 [Russula earlei]|uniref:Uncharacterized protein n=1 Tax=Russula earlei TaxID=71964 RepID=A0ACC0UNH7_9AGAM|nr:hypothetical protein F5148DRAFT_1158983 [Russula earlei]